MSEPAESDVPSGDEVAPVPFDWKRYTGRFFDVDYAESGDDVIYQFWPLDGQIDFHGGRTESGTPCFALEAERVFSELLPADAAVEADMIDVDEQRAIARVPKVGEAEALEQRLVRPHEADLDEVPPFRPTLYVKVRGMLARPMARVVLLEQLFTRLDAHLGSV